MADPDTEFALFTAEDYEVRQRVRSSGKAYTSVRVKVKPVLHNLASDEVGKGVAEGIGRVLTRAIKAINVDAAPATILRRQYAKRALAGGKRWATRRYAGGRTGAKEPGIGTKLFNDSLRFAEGIVVRFSGKRSDTDLGLWHISVPANRLDPLEFKGDAFSRMIQRLVQLVPELTGGDALWKAPEFQESLRQSVGTVLGAELAKRGQLVTDVVLGGLRFAQRLLT